MSELTGLALSDKHRIKGNRSKHRVIATVILCVATLTTAPTVHGEVSATLYGVWEPVEYVVAGSTIPLNGLIVIVPGYFIGNTTFEVDGDGILDANANSGPIEVMDGTIRLLQWMQLHWRSTGEGHFLKEGVPEEIPYTIDGDSLIFHFPSGNTYVSQRLKGMAAE